MRQFGGTMNDYKWLDSYYLFGCEELSNTQSVSREKQIIIFTDTLEKANDIIKGFQHSIDHYNERLAALPTISKTSVPNDKKILCLDKSDVLELVRKYDLFMDIAIKYCSDKSDILLKIPDALWDAMTAVVDLRHRQDDNFQTLGVCSTYALPKHKRTLSELHWTTTDILTYITILHKYVISMKIVLAIKQRARDGIQSSLSELEKAKISDNDYIKTRDNALAKRHMYSKLMHLTHAMYLVPMVRLMRFGEELCKPFK